MRPLKVAIIKLKLPIDSALGRYSGFRNLTGKLRKNNLDSVLSAQFILVRVEKLSEAAFTRSSHPMKTIQTKIL